MTSRVPSNLSFAVQLPPARVHFRSGALADLARALEEMCLERILILVTPGRVELGRRVASLIGARCVGVYAHARMHVPAEGVEEAVTVMRDARAASCLAVGGGSAIGLGKILARDMGAALIAVPTTYSGSEMTSIWGITRDGRKHTGRDPRALPRLVIYDPELTLTLPGRASVESAFNALAHAIEAMYALDGNPLITGMAEEAIAVIARALPCLARSPADTRARELALYGSWLAGMCLGTTSMGLHHKICHILGGTFDLPHAATHAIVLPHVLAFNAATVPAVARRIGRALATDDPAGTLHGLLTDLGARTSLATVGFQHADVAKVAEQTTAAPYANPRPVTAADVCMILADATEGCAPRAHQTDTRGNQP